MKDNVYKYTEVSILTNFVTSNKMSFTASFTAKSFGLNLSS